MSAKFLCACACAAAAAASDDGKMAAFQNVGSSCINGSSHQAWHSTLFIPCGYYPNKK